MTPSTLRLAFGLFAFGVTASGSATAKNVLTVGPGQPYATPSAAIAAAAPGDVIVVKPSCAGPSLCSYPGVSLGSKSLTLVGEEDASGMRPTIGWLAISNLAAGNVVTVRGFRVFEFGPPGAFIRFENNAGRIVVEDVFSQKLFYGTLDIVVVNSANVVLTRCFATGAPSPLGLAPGFPGLAATNSNVSAFDCVVTGGVGTVNIDGVSGPVPYVYEQPGGPGIALDGGSLYVAGGTIRGGNGGAGTSAGSICADGSAGGPGVHSESGNPIVRSLGAPLEGGAGGAAPPCGEAGSDGPPVQLDSGSYGAYSEPFRSIELQSPIRVGETSNVTIEGVPGEAAFVLVGAYSGSTFVPQLKGLLFPALPLQLLSFGNVPASGVLQLSAPIPAGVLPPGWQAIDVLAQVLVGGQTGSGVLGGPALQSVIDPAF